MRVLLLKQASDLQTLTTRLVGSSSATLERLKALNPHVDFNRIEPGTVLLLPDTPDMDAGDKDTRSPAGDALDDLVRHVKDGFQAAAARAASAGDDLAADRGAIAAAAKTAAFRRLVESDPLLKKQLDEAGEASDAELKKIREAAKQVEAMGMAAADELAALRRLLG